MAEISRLSRLLNGVQRGVDLSANTLVVQDLKLNGTLLSTTLSAMVSATSAAQADATSALANAATAEADAQSAISAAAAAQSTANSAQTDATSALTKAGHLVTLSGRPANSDDLGTFTGSIIPDTSTVKAALQSLESWIQSLPDPIVYKGTWNATTNTPALANADTGRTGWLYQVTVAGSVDFGAGSISFDVGDKVVNNGTIWDKWDMTDAVTSVNGQAGVVVLTTDNVSEGATNKYFTDEKAQDAVGGALTDTATIDFTYNDGANTITADVKNNSIDESKLTTSVAGAGLAGGNGTPLSIVYSPKGQAAAIAGETMAANTSWAVRWAVSGETAGRVYKADNDATSANKFYAWGIVLKTSSITVGAAVDVVFEGEYTLGSSDTPFSSGDVGKPVYLGAAGALTITPPTATDTASYRIGVVMTTTKIWVGDKQLNGIN